MTTKQKLQKQLAIDVELHQHIILVSSLLQDLITDTEQESEQQPQACSSIFDSKQRPDITIEDYLRRIHKLTRFSSQSLIVAIILMDRYIEQESFTLNWLNVHRILLSCLVLAVKLHDDFYFDNKAFETAGGVNVVMLEKYEIEIFEKCHHSLFVDEETYANYIQHLYNVYANCNEETDSDTEI